MQFRWIVLIALWTILSGPMFGPPASSSRTIRPRVAISPPEQPTAVQADQP